MGDRYEHLVKETEAQAVLKIRMLIVAACIFMLGFLYWFIDPSHIGHPVLFWMLTIGLSFKLIKMIHEWYHYWHVSTPVKPACSRLFTVDMLTTYCPGEPKEMIYRTLKAMLAVKYPHSTYLCDEANDDELKEFCRINNIKHVTRKIKIDAKAGNINNALKQATGELCVVLDPDHVPVPEFLDRVVPYFQDEKLGYVQVVQAYGNQEESWIALGAAEQTYHFYGPMMMCMNSYGTVQAIGANCTFRRAALDSIGGHAAGLSEDMHTAMQIHAKGWKSIYVPEILSRGLVPATLPAYYKQQLKWSRGTFDLLFHVLPGLFSKFSWRQKIHYLTLPMYFLFGLVNLFDILIPVIALTLADTPWAVDIKDFSMLFIPLCMTSIIIRLYAQRWLREKHERGFHLIGGLLRTGTWWIFLMGFVYTLLGIKVPYIPTPKEDSHQNNFILSLPNLIACLISVAAIIYGLHIDRNPYSIAMAVYAGINAIILAIVFFIGQEKLIIEIKERIRKSIILKNIQNRIFHTAENFRSTVYTMFKNGSIAITFMAVVLFLGYSNVDEAELQPLKYRKKNPGGFYMGLSIGNLNGNTTDFLNELKRSNSSFDVVSIDTRWDSVKPSELTLPELHLKYSASSMPLINWVFSENITQKEKNIFNEIINGTHDSLLTKYANQLRSFSNPVFIHLLPETTTQGTLNTIEYKKAWQYIYTFFGNMGVSNITWVWNPLHKNTSDQMYPGTDFVDWIGLTICNDENENLSFSQLYNPLRSQVGKFQKPVMIVDLHTKGSVTYQTAWFKEALKTISNYTEIKSFIVRKDFSQILSTGIQQAYLNQPPFNNKPFEAGNQTGPVIKKVTYKSKYIKGKQGNFELMHNGQPFYIKGIAYNTGHDWRDGNVPLTRKQLEKDFSMISEMGANTIRRYDCGMYDYNILNIAEEKNLKVMFGFWFDPKVDYYRDTVKVREYIRRVESVVKEYKNHDAVLAWSVGNETWGLLKHNYSKPYLTKVRQHYLKMIEYLAQQIHKIDPSHPVFTSMEHEEYQLAGELAAFHDHAPSIDVIGVNSYYEEQISQLNHLAYLFDSLRPYVVSEFGPRGYWNPDYTILNEDTMAIEDNDYEKLRLYTLEWKKYVEGFKGYNIGGVAYSWRDRMEGSNTWYGITDYKGRKKPVFYALKENWTNKKQSYNLIAADIVIPDEKLIPGHEYVFKASVQKNNLNYEWDVRKNEIMHSVNCFEVAEDGKSIRIKIPETSSRYRVYLYASDNQGNVSTSSEPILVR